MPATPRMLRNARSEDAGRARSDAQHEREVRSPVAREPGGDEQSQPDAADRLEPGSAPALSAAEGDRHLTDAERPPPSRGRIEAKESAGAGDRHDGGSRLPPRAGRRRERAAVRLGGGNEPGGRDERAYERREREPSRSTAMPAPTSARPEPSR